MEDRPGSHVVCPYCGRSRDHAELLQLVDGLARTFARGEADKDTLPHYLGRFRAAVAVARVPRLDTKEAPAASPRVAISPANPPARPICRLCIPDLLEPEIALVKALLDHTGREPRLYAPATVEYAYRVHRTEDEWRVRVVEGSQLADALRRALQAARADHKSWVGL